MTSATRPPRSRDEGEAERATVQRRRLGAPGGTVLRGSGRAKGCAQPEPRPCPRPAAARFRDSFQQVPCCSLFSCGHLSLQPHPRGVRQGLSNLPHAGDPPTPHCERALLEISHPTPAQARRGPAVPQIRRGSPAAVGAHAGPAGVGGPEERSHSASAALFRVLRTCLLQERTQRGAINLAQPIPRGPAGGRCAPVMSALPGRPPGGLTACQTR